MTNSNTCLRPLAAAIVAVIGPIMANAAPPTYRIEQIPRLPEMQVEEPMAINNKGEVTGQAYHNKHGNVCFKYSGGVTIELPDSRDHQCLGINDRGVIVGTDGERAYLWKKDGQKEALPSMKWVGGINRHGEVAGTIDVGNFEYHGALYADGVTTDLGLLDHASTYSEGLGLNDKGVVVGQGDGKPGFIRGVRWRNGKAAAIVNDGITTARAINNLGHITGTTGHDSTSFGAYFKDEAGLHPLPMVPNMVRMTPHGINERDEIVGTMVSTLGRDVAFYAVDGKAYWLLGLLDDDSRAAVTAVKTATSINDAGQIAGKALRDGRYYYPYIATPVAPSR